MAMNPELRALVAESLLPGSKIQIVGVSFFCVVPGNKFLMGFEKTLIGNGIAPEGLAPLSTRAMFSVSGSV